MPKQTKRRVPETVGRRQLAVWLASDVKRTRHALGKLIGVSGQAIGLWLARSSRPDERKRELLRIATGIEPSTWLTEHEVEARAEEERKANGEAA